ncbi:PD-(D/E)XK nuclease-like domain-containing protein [Humibacter sp.]|uniref:PD-(D/E)XK nuclease-like domain-containing protein n=1 Tax=Humibacter sp. TaxID=1940291 RepID=UPI003F815844
MSDAAYHARPELSSTEARLLLQSPAKYRWRKDNPPLIDDSPKFDIGKAVHAKVLGKGAEVVIVDAEDWRTKAAREARQEARDAGMAPLLRREYDAVNAMAESVVANDDAAALLSQPGDSEVSLFATVDGVPVRARFDYLPELGAGVTKTVDLKTTVDASKSAFERSFATYEYAIQRAWYLDAYTALTSNPAEMFFIAVEKTPPYLVAVYAIPTDWADRGHRDAAKARKRFAECTASGEWPGYPPGVQYLDEPIWHVYAEEQEEMVI